VSAVEFPEIAGKPFTAAPDAAPDAGDARHLVAVVDAQVDDIVEWTPDRAAAMVRGFGLVLHTLDPATELDGGDDLWRATSIEASEIGEPLSRILKRYAPARRLAPVVDEAELGAAFVSYAKRNLRTRGRVVLAERERNGGGIGED
jgi:hypothetical protein